MKLWLITILLLTTTAISAGNREDKIKSLMEAQGLLATFQQQLDMGRAQGRAQGQIILAEVLRNLSPPPKYQKQLEEAFNNYIDALASPWSADELVAVWAQYFGAKFTDPELDKLIQFYSSELGQKEVAATRESLIQFSTHFAEAAKPIIETTFQDFTAELQSIAKACNCTRKRDKSDAVPVPTKEDQLGALLDEARKLRDNGNLEQALSNYLQFFEQSYGTSYTGVRLSYVPAEIAAMGETYPPALDALRELRDVREQRLLNNKPTRDDIHEWSSLSEYLEGPEYAINEYDLLRRKGNTDPVILANILELNWGNFISAGRYKEMESLAFDKLSTLDQTVADWDSYAGDSASDADIRKAMFDYLVGEYARVYQVLLATDNIEKANSVSQTLLSLNKDGATYHALIDAAKAAGDNDAASLLLSQARTELSPQEYSIATEGKPKQSLCTGSETNL
jgi:hypothetical protein